ncbi:MAG: NTP transferase domain-containing protein [Flavobacteriales bacterium]|nr:NTP transferase domain-containing protein [Flavobacteriales bacterium]
MAAGAIGDITVVLLAAGRSTRFGRSKQLEPIGPHGETIMDLTLRDAFDMDCESACLVVRPEHEAIMREHYAKDERVRVAIQAQAQGTAHAALIGMEHALGTCIVANADDYYGRGSMRLACEHAREGSPQESALVAFELGKTLSPNGPVNRALCKGTSDHLRSTQEVLGLRRDADGAIRDAEGNEHETHALVSMNLWVLRQGFNHLAKRLWLERGEEAVGEFGLPDAARYAMQHKHEIRILRTTDRWCGLTFPADADLVRQHLAERP